MRARHVVLGIALATLASCARHGTPPEPAGAGTQPPAPEPGYESRLGHDIFAHYCATCHGDSGAGDGFNAYNLVPHPRDLSDPALQKKSDAEIADAIRRGGSGVGLSSLMPPWGHTLNERQIGEVVLYVRGLKKNPS